MSGLTIEVDGTQYGNFTSASATLRLDALSREFGFSASAENATPLPFKGNEACKIFADGDLILDGFIESVNVSIAAADHSIEISGRDKTADLLDSTINNLGSINAPISLRRLCELVVEDIGAAILVVDEAGPPSFKAGEDIANPDPATNSFEFLERHARKKQVLLTSNEFGDLVIASPKGTEIEAFVSNRIGDPAGSNNVLRSTMSFDARSRFRTYKTSAQANIVAVAIAGETAADVIADQSSGIVTDEEIRVGRQFVVMSENMSSATAAQDRAIWESRIRKSRGKVYAATVAGYRSQTGELWTPNTIINVRDEPADINARMLVNSVTFGISADGGSISTLSLLARNAYELTLSEPVTDDLGGETFA